MKSEERHQLLTNDLGAVTNRTTSFVEQHLATAITVVCIAVVASVIGFWWTTRVDTESEAAWKQLDSAKTIDEFGVVVDKYKGKPPAHWAELQISEKSLQEGLPLMFTNRELALADLKKARTGFESLANEKGVSATIRERALWGIAVCLEATCDGDTAKAIEAYGRLLSEYPSTMFKPVADERMVSLKNKEAGDFYAWFSKENPKPAEVRPQDIKIPGLDDNKKDDDADVKPAADPAATKPAAEAPAAEKPTEEKPAEEKKATEEKKPADEKATEERKPAEAKADDQKPAEEKPAEAAKPEADKPAPADAPKDGEAPKEPK